MEGKMVRAYVVVFVLMALASLALAFSVNVDTQNEAGVKQTLPERVGEWSGFDILYCNNPTCRREFTADQLDPGMTNCPVCGTPLETASMGERQLLPKDTVLAKKMYVHPSGARLFVSLVLSGKERVSIHRPEVCLVGQGHDIVESTVLSVPRENDEPLDIMMLETLRPFENRDGTKDFHESFYAYWFVGKDRETPYHVQRMWWMASDRVLRNVSHRWAYLSVGGTRLHENDNHHELVRSFVKDFDPAMRLH